MAQETAFGEQFNALLGRVLLARQGVFAKSRSIAHCRAFAFKKQRRAVIDNGADAETDANKPPSVGGSEAEAAQHLGTLVAEFDGQRRDQRARSKGQNAAQDPFGETGIQAETAPTMDDDVGLA